MASIQDIALKRWFMGKGSRIKSVTEEDRVEIAGNAITIVRVTFTTNRPPDLYATVEDESRIGGILDKAFSKARFTVPAKHGKFIFERTSGFPARISAEALDSIAPLDAEQSNSAYVSKRFFFKLYRRLLPGIHPEAEIMEHFGDIGYGGSPRLCGKCRYADASGILYTLGILESRCHGGTDAWAAFNKRMDERSAEALGKATAKMHRALKGLPGTPAQNPEVPFDKLEKLLRTFKSDNEQTQTLAVKLKAALPELKKLAKFPKARIPLPIINRRPSRFSISKASRHGRSNTAGRSAPPPSTSQACCAVSNTRVRFPTKTAPHANTLLSKDTPAPHTWMLQPSKTTAHPISSQKPFTRPATS